MGIPLHKGLFQDNDYRNILIHKNYRLIGYIFHPLNPLAIWCRQAFMGIMFIVLSLNPIAAQKVKKTDILICWSSDVKLEESVAIQIFTQGRLIYFEKTDTESCVTTTIERNISDTLFIFLKTKSFAGSAVVLPDSNSSFSVLVKLSALPKSMEEIIIKPNGYTKKGDTTSYFVNFYAQPNHEVLRDVLNNIPYINLEADGQITYKGKLISSIMIQGEEVFSDQYRLLANHIPIHVLKSIELIENAPSNNLLKGVERNADVVMNLSIKEKYKGKLWGTLSGGFGNEKRFEILPVIFSLKNKLKIGWIGKSYLGGQAADMAERTQMKTSNLVLLQQITGQTPALLVPIEKADRYFSRNNQTDHRIQITRTINDHSTLTAEGRFFNNTSSQQTNYMIARISDSMVIKQQWFSSKTCKPVHISFRLKYVWENQQNHISLNLNWQREQDQPTEISNFSEQETSFFYSHNLRQASKTKSIETNWIQKKDNTAARKILARIEYTSFNRNTMHILPQDFGFSVTESGTNMMLTQLSTINLTSFQTQYQKLGSTKSKCVKPIQWNLDWKQLQIHTNLTETNDSSLETTVKLSQYSGTSKFGVGRIHAEFKLDKKKNQSFQKYFIQAGAALYLLNDKNIFTDMIIRPVFQVQRETETVIPKWGIMGTSLQFKEGETDILKLNRSLMPYQGLNYTSYVKPAIQNRSIFISFNLRGSTGKKILPQTELSAFIQFYSPVFKTTVSGPLTETFVQLISKPSSSITLSNHIQFLSGNKLPMIKTSTRISYQENFFLTGDKRIKITNGLLQAEITADWQIMSTLRLSIYGRLDYRFFPNNQFKEQIPVTRNMIFRKNLKIYGQISPKASFEYSAMINENNFRNWIWSDAIFSDASFRWKLHPHFNFYLDVYNLFNLSGFSLSDQNPSYLQSRLSIPLMARHFLTGLTWKF